MNIFEIIGPIMIGPSSSHTAGAVRLGRLARAIVGGQPDEAMIGLHGSFAQTYRGHGTDRALAAGLLGMRPDDGRIPQALEIASQNGLKITFEIIDLGRDRHPNSARIDLVRASVRRQVIGSSFGGGRVAVVEIDGFPVEIDGRSHTLITEHHDRPGVVAKTADLLARRHINIAAMRLSRRAPGGTALMTIEVDGDLDSDVARAVSGIDGIEWAVHLEAVD